MRPKTYSAIKMQSIYVPPLIAHGSIVRRLIIDSNSTPIPYIGNIHNEEVPLRVLSPFLTLFMPVHKISSPQPSSPYKTNLNNIYSLFPQSYGNYVFLFITFTSISAKGSIAFIASCCVFVCAPTSTRRDLGSILRLYL